jgi:hypothetical protein
MPPKIMNQRLFILVFLFLSGYIHATENHLPSGNYVGVADLSNHTGPGLNMSLSKMVLAVTAENTIISGDSAYKNIELKYLNERNGWFHKSIKDGKEIKLIIHVQKYNDIYVFYYSAFENKELQGEFKIFTTRQKKA